MLFRFFALPSPPDTCLPQADRNQPLTGSTTMIRSRFIRSLALALSGAIALSCSDISPTGPPGPRDSPGRVALWPHRRCATARGQSGRLRRRCHWLDRTPRCLEPGSRESFLFGVRNDHTVGGTLTIPQADFTTTFPVGAVSQLINVTITSDPNLTSRTRWSRMGSNSETGRGHPTSQEHRSLRTAPELAAFRRLPLGRHPRPRNASQRPRDRIVRHDIRPRILDAT